MHRPRDNGFTKFSRFFLKTLARKCFRKIAFAIAIDSANIGAILAIFGRLKFLDGYKNSEDEPLPLNGISDTEHSFLIGRSAPNWKRDEVDVDVDVNVNVDVDVDIDVDADVDVDVDFVAGREMSRIRNEPNKK